MQMLEVPMDRQHQTAPDVRLDVVDGNPDLHSVCGFEHWANEQGWGKIVNKARNCGTVFELDRR
ncbi:hypothetical protein U8Q05_31095 (plasmid) [Rhizobium ruizarguesonis]|nr:hypothetical protein U8Q05_30960 [Rhizobium ruizarguesonis]WSH68667.1 hypothetical protein U8Q05_31095 [Rhizobium ruizarguesonis]